jgi:isoleucyl-tRNA synthetase
MYLAQNPAQDLRFGTRHPDRPVTLQTMDGPITHTKEGLPCCKVTSKPADEVRRLVLLPVWNSYAFFVNYARLDGFDPSLPTVPVSERPEIDQWILSNLQAFLATANEHFAAFDVAEVCRSAAAFIDDLSNWYIRRNRRRFWRSRTDPFSRDPKGSAPSVANAPHSSPLTTHHSPAPDWDPDKLAAYQTLYEVLVTLTKALAPVVPFLCERMYGNLVSGGVVSGGEVPESVHLCAYPQPDSALLKPELNRRTALAQRIVRMGHRLREEANQRVRQPLAELKYACASEQDAADVAAYADVIADELNVKRLTRAEHLDELVHYTYKPNLKTLGPKYGKRLNEIRTLLSSSFSGEQKASKPASDLKSQFSDQFAPLRRGETVTITPPTGDPITLTPEDVLITTEQAADWAVADEPGIQIALSTIVTPELIQEGMARDFVRHIQQARKDANLEITDRIRIGYTAGDEVAAAVEAWRDYIARETLADAIERDKAPADAKSVLVGEFECRVGIVRVQA